MVSSGDNRDNDRTQRNGSIKLTFSNKINVNEETHESKSMIDIQRKTVDTESLEKSYGKRERSPPKSLIKELKDQTYDSTKKYCQNFSFLGWITSLFPIFTWIRSYSLQNYLITDIIAGFTISILHIPQGLANGLLAGLSPINGLYVSFFPGLLYVFMGTGFHTSIGTFSVMSIMVSEAASTVLEGADNIGDIIDGVGNSTATSEYTPLEVLTSLCLLCGIIQLLMGFLHLGVLSVVFSDTLISGLQTAAAIHVASSQLPMLFNIRPDKIKTRYFKLIYEWISIISHLGDANLITVGLGLSSIVVLLVVKEYIEPTLREKYPKFKVPIPIDILIVIIATLISWLLDLGSEEYKVDIVGEIKLGIPAPQLPRFDLFPALLMDAVVISVVAYAITLSLGRTFGKMHNYEVDANQELIALGSANVFSSLFYCFTCCPALSRTSVADRVGGKTQITGLVSSVILLVVLLFLGGIFYNLPKCILAAIIIVALKTMFMQIKDFPKALKISKLEGLSWFVTFISVILLDMDLGLLVGILIALSFILIRLSMPNSLILGQLPNSELYVDIKDYSEAMELKGIKIFHFSSSLFFINRQSFKENLYKKVFNISSNANKASIFAENHRNPDRIHTVIIDCSPINYIDSSGVGSIEEVIRELKLFDINVVLASCNEVILQMFEKTKFYDKSTHNIYIYASIHDAVVSNLFAHNSKITQNFSHT